MKGQQAAFIQFSTPCSKECARVSKSSGRGISGRTSEQRSLVHKGVSIAGVENGSRLWRPCRVVLMVSL